MYMCLCVLYICTCMYMYIYICICSMYVCMYVYMFGFFTSVSNKNCRDPCFLIFPRIFHLAFAISKIFMISCGFSYVTVWTVTCPRRLSSPLTLETRVYFQSSQCGICGVSGGTGTVFLRVIRFFLSKCSFHKRSIFIRLSFRGWTLGPLEDTVHPKNNKQLFFE